MKLNLSERDIANLIYICLWVSREAEEGNIKPEKDTDNLSYLNTSSVISRTNELLETLWRNQTNE